MPLQGIETVCRCPNIFQKNLSRYPVLARHSSSIHRFPSFLSLVSAALEARVCLCAFLHSKWQAGLFCPAVTESGDSACDFSTADSAAGAASHPLPSPGRAPLASFTRKCGGRERGREGGRGGHDTLSTSRRPVFTSWAKVTHSLQRGSFLPPFCLAPGAVSVSRQQTAGSEARSSHKQCGQGSSPPTPLLLSSRLPQSFAEAEAAAPPSLPGMKRGRLSRGERERQRCRCRRRRRCSSTGNCKRSPSWRRRRLLSPAENQPKKLPPPAAFGSNL